MIWVDIVEDMEMVKVTLEIIHSPFSQSRSRIQSTQSGFKLIKFDINRKEQAGKLIRYGDVMVGKANIPIIKENNCFLFENNVKYDWARIIQASKQIKKSMIIFFINPNLTPMWKHLSYKNIYKIKVLLTQ